MRKTHQAVVSYLVSAIKCYVEMINLVSVDLHCAPRDMEWRQGLFSLDVRPNVPRKLDPQWSFNSYILSPNTVYAA